MPLYPSGSPAARTRAERFDALVLEALEPIEERWGTELAELDVAVDDVPEVPAATDDPPVDDDAVLGDGEDLADLLHDVLVEQVAGYLGVEPDTIAGDED